VPRNKEESTGVKRVVLGTRVLAVAVMVRGKFSLNGSLEGEGVIHNGGWRHAMDAAGIWNLDFQLGRGKGIPRGGDGGAETFIT